MVQQHGVLEAVEVRRAVWTSEQMRLGGARYVKGESYVELFLDLFGYSVA